MQIPLTRISGLHEHSDNQICQQNSAYYKEKERICTSFLCHDPCSIQHRYHSEHFSMLLHLYILKYIYINKLQSWIHLNSQMFCGLLLTEYYFLVYLNQIREYDSYWVWLNTLNLGRWDLWGGMARCLNGEKKKQKPKKQMMCVHRHIPNVDWHFASPNVVISLQIICLPLDGSCISTHSSTIFPSVLTAPNFIALCQSSLEITVTDTHPAHFREIISMLSVRHVATQHRSLVQDHYQKLLPLWPGYFIPAI